MEQILSEEDMMTDSLLFEKSSISQYAVFLSDATCQNFRNYINRILTENQQVQFEILNAIRSRGWISIKNALLDDTNVILQKYQQILATL